MSSIQDRIRRLESSSGNDDTLPPSGAVAAAKARLNRASVDDQSASRSVSNIASRFAATAASSSVDDDHQRTTPTVAQLRERVAASGAEKPSVSARAAAFAADETASTGSARVTARRDALQATSAVGGGGGVAARAAAFASSVDSTVGVSGGVAVRAGRFEEAETAEPVATKAKSLASEKSGSSSAVAQRTGRFEKAVSADVPTSKPGASGGTLAAKKPSAPTEQSGVTHIRSRALEREREKRAALETKRAASPRVAAARAAFDDGSEVRESKDAAAASSSKTNKSSFAAATAAFNKAEHKDEDDGAKVGRVASVAKDRELHSVRLELADMVQVSKDLLSELASLRASMRDMEATRDALIQRVEKLERKAKK